jgi:hypothetical protein
MARAMQAFENRSRRHVLLSEGLFRAKRRRRYDHWILCFFLYLSHVKLSI